MMVRFEEDEYTALAIFDAGNRQWKQWMRFFPIWTKI